MKQNNIAVIGAGGWGTALSDLLVRKGEKVHIWDLDAALLAALKADGENKKYLPGVEISKDLEICETVVQTLEGANFLLLAVPAQHMRTALKNALPLLSRDIVVVNVAKGIEQGTLKTLSQVAEEVAPGFPFVTLSGPSHAEEVGRGAPTTVVSASKDEAAASAVQELFMTERFRVYTNTDVLGVELGGALKNIIALGAGILDGMGYGDNTKAALMTRGLTEMARLGEAMGARRETFFGLSGVGDLIVTCTSMHSRNRRCGIMLGEGVPAKEATERVGMVVEGVTTSAAADELAKKLGVDMPITSSICAVVRGEIRPEAALSSLMTRDKKTESL